MLKVFELSLSDFGKRKATAIIRGEKLEQWVENYKKDTKVLDRETLSFLDEILKEIRENDTKFIEFYFKPKKKEDKK